MAKFDENETTLILQGIEAKTPWNELAEMLGISQKAIAQRIYRMRNAGLLESSGKGHWMVVKETAEREESVEHRKKRVEIAPFFKGKKARTILIRRTEEEVHAVVRLELKLEDVWVPIPFDSTVILYFGDRVPLHSPTQETYENVCCVRMTQETGHLLEFVHDSSLPLTIDFKKDHND